jgi:hypothetical protein
MMAGPDGRHGELRVDQSSSRMAQLKQRVEPAVRLARAGLPGRVLGRLIQVSFLDRTVILAGQAFSAILPLIMVVNAVSPYPGGDSPAVALARRLGLGPRDVSSLQRSYELAWRLPPAGLRPAWRPLALLIGLAIYVELLFLFSRLVRGVPAGRCWRTW